VKLEKVIIEAAPIAGYTNQAFRRVLIKLGAKVVYTEMISATAMYYKSDKTLELLTHDVVDGIKNVLQLFGKVPEHFEYAIKSGHLDAFDEININMGCPAPKIIKNGEGAALMKTPELARQIIESCFKATNETAKPKPITVKFRLGYKEPNFTAVEFAKMCEKSGASKIIVHGRYASQGYSGTADWQSIKEVVNAVKIPVIANGDITNAEKIIECLETTNANGVMIARSLFGSPWKINPIIPIPNNMDIKQIIEFHIDSQEELHGKNSFNEIKKHLLAYCNNFENSKELKLKIAVSKSFDEAKEILGLN